jgi:hypothetical protein
LSCFVRGRRRRIDGWLVPRGFFGLQFFSTSG